MYGGMNITMLFYTTDNEIRPMIKNVSQNIIVCGPARYFRANE